MKGDLDEQVQESEMETKFIKKKKWLKKLGKTLLPVIPIWFIKILLIVSFLD